MHLFGMQDKISNLPLPYVYPTVASPKSPLYLVAPSGVERGVEHVDVTFRYESMNA